MIARVVSLTRPSAFERAFVPSIVVVSSSSSSVPIGWASASPRVTAVLARALIVPIAMIVPIVATTIVVPIVPIAPVVPVVPVVRTVARHRVKEWLGFAASSLGVGRRAMASRSPFGDADSDEDDDWLNDVAPAASEDVGNASWLSDSEVRAGTPASESSTSVPPTREDAGAVGKASERREETPIAREATETSAFGAVTPRAFGSPRATTPMARHTAAFQTTPASPSAHEVEPIAGGFVEVSNGDLGALFGGDDADDDWMSPTTSGARETRDHAPVASAAPVQAPAVAFGVEQMSPTQVVHAASAPFASPPMAPQGDGVDLFNSFDDKPAAAPEPERSVPEPVVVAPEPQPTSANESEAYAPTPAVHAQYAPFGSATIEKDDGMDFFNNLDSAAETSAAGPFNASSTSTFVEGPTHPDVPALAHEAPAAVEADVNAYQEPETKEEISYQPQQAFYEESHAPAHEYPQTEFVTGGDVARQTTPFVAELVHEPAPPPPPAQVIPPPPPPPTQQHEHQDIFSHPAANEPVAPIHFQEHAPETQFTQHAEYVQEPIVSAPPMIPAYSSENLHSRVSSSNSVAELQTPPPTPLRPTFMVPTPIHETATLDHGGFSQSQGPVPFTPPPRVDAVYEAYEPARTQQPQRLEYTAAPSASYGGYASGQQMEYAAYSESATQKPVRYDDVDRSPHGRPHHVAMSFGFGGSLMLSGPGFPGGRTSHGSTIPPCSLRVYSVSSLLKDGSVLGNEYVRSMEELEGPFANRRTGDVMKMMDAAVAAERDQGREGESLLYRVLQTMLRHKGDLLSTTDMLGEGKSGAFRELATLLTGDASSAADGGWVAASASLSPLNPANAADETAITRVESLLIAGRRGEALRVAIEARLWPHALLLARHLGGQHYQDTVAAMAKSACRLGSPLHTLEMIMAGLPEELAMSVSRTPVDAHGVQAPSGASKISELLPRWREHVAILCANPTCGGEFVLKALGDELARQNDIDAAHVAYALSSERPAPYGFNSRLCLVGADHKKFPRTYVSPRAVQLSEIFESAVLGSNSQAQMAALLPYKLLLAGALAEVGKLRQALAYVESVLKSVRSLDRHCPEVNAARVGVLAAQLEDQLHNALKGKGGRLAGAAAGAAKSLVSGVRGLLDRSVSSLFGDGGEFQQSQPTPRQTCEPHQQQQYAQYAPQYAPHAPNAVETHPMASTTPAPAQHAAMHATHQRTPSGSGLLRSVSSLFGASGQKPPSPPEPTTSQENAFYYDEERKMWLERGKEPPKEAPPVGAPPVRTPSEQSVSGLDSTGPPPLASQNGHSPHSKQGGVRSRYVDTFNHAASQSASPHVQNGVAAQGFVPAAPNAAAAMKTPSQFFMPAPSVSHSRDESTESYSSSNAHASHAYAPHERNGSFHEDNGFYGYGDSGHPTEPSPPPALAQPPTQPNAIPGPPVIDPALLAAPSLAPGATLPPSHHHHHRGSSAELVTEELHELNLQ